MREKRGVKKIIGVVCFAIAIITIIVIALMHRETPEQKVARLLDLGQHYLLEEDYEQAIASFDEVLSIEPRNEKAIDNEVKAYLAWSDKLTENGEYEYAVQVLKDGYGKLSTEEMKERLENAEIRAGISEYESSLFAMTQKIISDEDYDFSDLTILSGEFSEIVGRLTQPIFFKVENNIYLGVYPGGYIYYGEMEQGIRSGHGFWYYGDIEEITKVETKWTNDKPNGEAIIEKNKNPDKIEREAGHTYALHIVESVLLKDGVYDGEADLKWDMDDNEIHEWNVIFNNGILQAVSGDAAGFCVNCGADLRASDTVEKISGIE